MGTEKRMIYADAVKALIEEIQLGYNDNGYDEWLNGIYLGLGRAIDEIEDAPTVDAVEVVHGRWENMDNDPKCSECGIFAVSDKHAVKYYDYCPHCGAKMDGDENA